MPAVVEGTRENSRLDFGRRPRRAGARPGPKQYRPLNVGSAVARSVAVMLAQPGIDLVQVVIAAGDRPLYDAALPCAAARLLPPVAGGATRQQSALQGLLALAAHAPDCVLIHDSARPFVTADIIARVLAALAHAPAAIAALPVTDSLKRADASGRIAHRSIATGLWRAQTPQGFAFSPDPGGPSRRRGRGTDHA